jgi:putative MATE family efflux protein
MTGEPATAMNRSGYRLPPSALVSGPIGKTLFLFTIPLLGSNILQSLNGLVNAVWVGRYLGEAALTATSNAHIVMFFLLGLVFGISMAATILIGQAVGSDNLERIKRVVGTSTTFFVLLSVAGAIAGFLLTPPILALMHTPPDALPLASAYLRIIFLALPFMYFSTLVTTMLRGAGDAKTPFYFLALAVLLDIAFNPLLILGIGPLPAMGIAGSGAATLVSQVLSLAAMIAYMYLRKSFLCLYRGEFHYLKFDRVILTALVRKGLPMGVQIIMISLSAVAMISMVNAYGSQTTAAYGICTQLWTFVQMPAIAVGAAASSMAAQNIGANRWDRVSQIVWYGVIFSFVLTGLPLLGLYGFSETSLGIFLPSASGAVEIAKHINYIVSWSFMFFGIAMVIFGVVRATGATMAPLFILFVALWLVRIPFAKYFETDYGADSIWWSFPIGTFVTVGLAMAYYRYGNWRNAQMIDEEPSGQAPDTGLAPPDMVSLGEMPDEPAPKA